MYEEKKQRGHRVVSFKLLGDLPWSVRAFFILLFFVLVAILVFGGAAAALDVPVFGLVASELTGFLKIIIGAIIGALTAEANAFLKRKVDVARHDAERAN